MTSRPAPLPGAATNPAAIAQELERLFAGHPAMAPFWWEYEGRKGYSPLRQACPACPAREEGKSAWKLHAAAESERVLVAAVKDGEVVRGSTAAAKRRAAEILDAHNVADAPSLWLAHVLGQRNGRPFFRGVYTVVPGETPTTRVVALDLDDKAEKPGLFKPQARLEALAAAAQELGVASAFIGNTSRGGRGRHARLCVDPSTPAWLARALGQALLVKAGISPAPQPEGGQAWVEWVERFGRDPENGVEVYPKQGAIDRAGNLLALPCHLPLMAEGKTALLEPGTWTPVLDGGRALELLRAVEPLPLERVRELARALGVEPERPPEAAKRTRGPASLRAPRAAPRPPCVVSAFEVEWVREAVGKIPPDGRDEWLAVGMALHHWNAAQARELWDAWSETSEKYDEIDQENTWNGFHEDGNGNGARTLGTVLALAEEYGWERLALPRKTVEAAVAATATDCGAMHTPDVIDALKILEREDPASLERAKGAAHKKVNKSTLNALIRQAQITRDLEASAPVEDAEETASEILLRLALQDAELVRDLDGEAFLWGRGTSRPVVRLGGRAGELWLSSLARRNGLRALTSTVLEQARLVLTADAQEVPQRDVPLRVGRTEAAVYIDMGDPSWRALEVTATGWRVVAAPPIPIRRSRRAGVLPEPTRHDERTRASALADLRQLLRLEGEEHEGAWVQVCAWFLAAYGARAPFPLLTFIAGPGSGKSAIIGAIVSLVDPRSMLRGPPKEEKDLAVAGYNAYVIAFDNISSIPGWLSDGLCRLATGGGVAARSLYTDADEVTFDHRRPVLITATGQALTRGDLLNRAWTVELRPVPADDRRTEEEVETELAALRPRALGAFLDALVAGLAGERSVTAKLPRLADASRLAIAAAPTLGLTSQRVAEALAEAERASASVAVDVNVIVPPLRQLLASTKGHCWTGTMAALLDALRGRADVIDGFPRQPSFLGTLLAELEQGLSLEGITIERHRTKTMRTVTIRRDAGAAP